MLISLSIIILEILLRLITNQHISSHAFIEMLPVSVFASLLLTFIFSFIKNKKVRRIITLVIIEIITVWFTISFFTYDTYKVFMSPEIISQEAGNVATVFKDRVIAVITKGIGYILIFHIPVAASLFLSKINLKFGKDKEFLAILCAAFLCLSLFFSIGQFKEMAALTYDDSVKTYGLIPSLGKGIAKKFVKTPDFEIIQSYEASESANIDAAEDTEDEEPEEETDYGYNVMDLDFDYLMTQTAKPNVLDLFDYVQTVEPSCKNEYTGIFEGKNLILICAEAFTKEVIDEQRTPTLYRLANKGIVFEDFYQPAWGGSTSTGEFSFLTGLVPTEATAMQYACHNNMYFTLGNQLQREGYFSRAYHNGIYEYYDRCNTHTNLGYSYFIAYNNGLEGRYNGNNAASSDLGLMIATVPDYIDEDHFSIYYMTISGHCNYIFDSTANPMAVKNKAITDDMPYSQSVRAYYSCQMELEYALEYLVNALEEAGKADDTVIAIVSDHYPYGLLRSVAWETTSDQLSELYGYDCSGNVAQDHNACIIWSGCLEDEDPIVVSEPTYSLDVVPTLSNLFGLEYDSRMLVGRDVFSDTEPLVLWNDNSWLTDKGYYHSGYFYPTGDETATDEYIESVNQLVKNKKYFSEYAMDENFYKYVFGEDSVK